MLGKTEKQDQRQLIEPPDEVEQTDPVTGLSPAGGQLPVVGDRPQEVHLDRLHPLTTLFIKGAC